MTTQFVIAAVLMVAGAAVFFLGVIPIALATPRLSRHGDDADLAKRLTAIATHLLPWRAMMAASMVAWVLHAAGFSLLGFAGGVQPVLGVAAAATYLAVVPLLLAFLSFQLSATPAAAAEWGSSGEVPSWFVGVNAWMERGLYPVYMLGAFASLAGMGWALRDLIPSGVAWAVAGFGALLFVVFASGRRAGRFNPADLPLWVHVWGLAVGIWIIASHR